MLRKNPGFTAIAMLTLALAIGVNSGVFWLVNEILFKPLIPLRPNEVVNVYSRNTEVDPNDGGLRNFSFSEFSLLRESREVFADVSAWQDTMVRVGTNDSAEMSWKFGFVVSENYFSMLGVTPDAGRFFLPEETRPNANIPVVVVSESMWESMGGDNDFSKRTVTINGKVCTIVGAAPKEFCGTLPLVSPDIWLPMGMASAVFMDSGGSSQNLTDPTAYILEIIARLKPKLTLEAAKARLPVLTDRLKTIAADIEKGDRTLQIGHPNRFGGGQPDDHDEPLYLFGALTIGMAGVVLLVACLNLANMFLARNTTRSDELAVRLALGAPYRRIIRLLSVEGLILALVGGAAGLLVSRFGISLCTNSLMSVTEFTSLGISVSLDTTPDIRVLMATLLFCVIATLVFAVAPAWRVILEISKGNLSLQHSTRTTTERWGRLFSGRHCLLMAQLAFSQVLLFGGGLFFRAAITVSRIDPGFEPKGDLVAEIDYTLVHRDGESARIFMTTLREGLQASTGVRRVAIASSLPFFLGNMRIPVSTADATGKQVRTAIGAGTAVSNGYFDTLEIKLLRGRDFTHQECLQTGGPPVVIIDQGMADALFPGEDPLGKYIQRSQGPGKEIPSSEPMEIVGVVSPHWHGVLEESSPPLRIFFPLASLSTQFVYIHVRGQTADAASSGAFHEQVRSKMIRLDPDIPLVSLKPYPTLLKGSIELWVWRFAAVLFGILGAIAFLLAVIGVYGVRAFFVARRRREIGIRMALGASPQRIYALLIKQGAVQIAIGMCVGVMLSLAAGKLLASMLLHVSPGDPLVLGMAALILVIAAFLATWIPAWRAANVDPMEVLRWE